LALGAGIQTGAPLPLLEGLGQGLTIQAV
jgi:hypothetical protein